jgi:hypothetical protein
MENNKIEVVSGRDNKGFRFLIVYKDGIAAAQYLRNLADGFEFKAKNKAKAKH